MRLPDLNDLIQDLQLAKQIAIEDRNPNAIIMATIGQAKLLGIDKPPIKDVNADAVQTISDLMDELADSKEQPKIDYSILSDDELRQLASITQKMDKAALNKRISHA